MTTVAQSIAPVSSAYRGILQTIASVSVARSLVAMSIASVTTKTLNRNIASVTTAFQTINKAIAPQGSTFVPIQVSVPPTLYSCTITVRVNGKTQTMTDQSGKLFGRAAQAEISIDQNASLDWKILIQDDDGQMQPELTSGPWTGWMDGNAYDQNNNVVKTVSFAGTLQASATVQPEKWGPFVGVPKGYGYHIDPTDPTFNFAFRGKGVSDPLFYRERETLDGFSSTPAENAQMAGFNKFSSHLPHVSNLLILSLCQYYGVPADIGGLAYVYRIARMAFQGKQPAVWIQRLVNNIRSAWHEEEGTVKFYQPNIPGMSNFPVIGALFGGTPQPSRYYTLGTSSISSLDVDNSAVYKYTRIVAQRADDVGAVIGRAGGDKFGSYTVQISPPTKLQNITIKGQAFAGVLSDFWLFSGPALVDVRQARGAVPPVSLGAGGGLVDKIIFAFGPDANSPTATSGVFNVIVTGDNGAYEDTTRGVIAQASNLTGVGIRTKEMKADPLICTHADLSFVAWVNLFYLCSDVRRTTWKVPFDPKLFPNMVCQVTDPILGVTRKIYVEGVKHTLSSDPRIRSTTWKGVEYLAPITPA